MVSLQEKAETATPKESAHVTVAEILMGAPQHATIASANTGVAHHHDQPSGPPPAAVRAITLITREHRAIACMLAAMRALVASYRGPGRERDYAVLESMLVYVENVPDRVHHPKEAAVLFPALARQTSEGKRLVDELEQEHACGRTMLKALHDAVSACRTGAIGGLDRLVLRVDEFAAFYGDHMRKEEECLLPLAIAHLAAEDWQNLERAFGDHVAPPLRAELAGDYRRLYQCIAEVLPAPLRAYLDDATPGGTTRAG